VEAFVAVSFVRTLILVAVAAALGAYIYFVEEPAAVQQEKANYLADFDPAAVTGVKLSYPDQDAIEVVREGDQWKLKLPIEYPAEKSVIDNFLTTIKDTKIERRLEKEEAGTLATYGLEGPTGTQARIEMTLEGGKQLPAIVLGNATPVGFQAFALRDGDDQVLVIPLLLQSSAKKTPLDLRSKPMFAGVDSTGIEHVTIEKPDGKIELDRKGDAAWFIQSPLEDAADAESVRSMLDSIATIDAVAFFDGPAADRKGFGLEEGATRFRAVRADGTSVGFTIGKEATDQPAGIYFERQSDHQVIKAPDWVAKKFLPDANDLRDKRLLSCKLDEIRSLKYTFAGDTFTLEREDAGKPWTIDPALPDQVVNQRVVANALNGLVVARADDVVGDAAAPEDLAKYGLDKPLARLEVGGAKGSCGALSAAPAPAAPAQEGRPAPPQKYYVKADARSAVLLASQHEYSRLAVKRSEYVDAATAAPAAKTQDGEPKKAE
jgi:hypothetical protein